MKTTSLLWLLALVSGALIPVQAAANAALSKSIHGNIPFAAMMLFVVAAGATVISVLVAGVPVPSMAELRSTPWWSFWRHGWEWATRLPWS